MEQLELLEATSSSYHYLSIFIFMLVVVYTIRSLLATDEDKYYSNNLGVMPTPKNKLFNRAKVKKIENLMTLDSIKLFKDINNEVERLEKNVSKNKNAKVAFDFGEDAEETIEWLRFLESKKVKIIASKNILSKNNDNIDLLNAASIFLEDKNGVIYLIIVFRDNEIKLEKMTLMKYDFLPLMVLKENHLAKLKKNMDATGLFIPKEKYGEALVGHTRQTHIIEDVKENILVIVFFWTKEHNLKLYFSLDKTFTEKRL